MSDIPDTAGPWPGWAPGDPWPSSTGAALSPSSLRAELAEAKATIARLERDLRLAEGHLLDTNVAFEQKCNKLAAQSDIVVAATALAEFWRDQVPLEYCHDPEQDRLTDALIAAVEEGNKT